MKKFKTPIATSIKIPYEGGELQVDIVTSNGQQYAQTKGIMCSKGELQALIGSKAFGQETGPQYTAFVNSTHFTFGCNGQYKGITAESIQKVIDLL